MELTQLRYFLLVAEHKKISKAAILAFTSQSNLSKQIAQLETALDCQLFERTNSGVELTNAGKYLYKELKPVLAKLDRIFENVQKQEKDHPIRISTCSNLDVEQGCPSLFKKIRERTDIEIIDFILAILFRQRYKHIRTTPEMFTFPGRFCLISSLL